jgi:mannose-6-phosphate isomerase-like protein (cupin superfamily)
VDEGCGAKNLHIHITVLEPGARAHPPHKHEGEEAFYIIEGTGEVIRGDKSFKVEAGSVVFLPPQELHGIRNTGKTPLKYMVIICAATRRLKE